MGKVLGGAIKTRQDTRFLTFQDTFRTFSVINSRQLNQLVSLNMVPHICGVRLNPFHFDGPVKPKLNAAD